MKMTWWKMEEWKNEERKKENLRKTHIIGEINERKTATTTNCSHIENWYNHGCAHSNLIHNKMSRISSGNAFQTMNKLTVSTFTYTFLRIHIAYKHKTLFARAICVLSLLFSKKNNCTCFFFSPINYDMHIDLFIYL